LIPASISTRIGASRTVAIGKAGLREGDVIQEVNKQPVKNAKDLVAISKKLKANEKILLRVYSQGRSGYIALEPK
jgi:S1-C subfamily serine protease